MLSAPSSIQNGGSMVNRLHSIAAALSMLLAASLASAQAPGELRLTPAEIAARTQGTAGVGTSGVASIRTTVLVGDPTKPGLYSLRLTVPSNTTIAAHTHRDERSAIVVSGTWFFGYGRVAADEALKALPAGSFYTEPAGAAHFAMTKDEPVEIVITGYGPTDTQYVDPANDPNRKR
jgi:quercetin dioxygenase-like cupin family protein